MKLTSTNVNTVLMDCLFKKGEDTTNYIEVQAVMRHLGLNPERVEKHKEDIESMLSQLPDSFNKGKGDDNSFLNAAVTNSGEQWGEHGNVDELLCLGLAIDKVEILLPREMWNVFPGGMPYFVIN